MQLVILSPSLIASLTFLNRSHSDNQIHHLWIQNLSQFGQVGCSFMWAGLWISSCLVLWTPSCLKELLQPGDLQGYRPFSSTGWFVWIAFHSSRACLFSKCLLYRVPSIIKVRISSQNFAEISSTNRSDIVLHLRSKSTLCWGVIRVCHTKENQSSSNNICI